MDGEELQVGNDLTPEGSTKLDALEDDFEGLALGEVRKLAEIRRHPDRDQIIDSWRADLAQMLMDAERSLRATLYSALHPDPVVYPVPHNQTAWEWFEPPEAPDEPPYDIASPWPDGPLYTEGSAAHTPTPMAKTMDLSPANLAYAVSCLEMASHSLDVYKQLLAQYVALADWPRDFRGRPISERLPLADLAAAMGLKSPQGADNRVKRGWDALRKSSQVASALLAGWRPPGRKDPDEVGALRARPWGQSDDSALRALYEDYEKWAAQVSGEKWVSDQQLRLIEVNEALATDGVCPGEEVDTLADAYGCGRSLAAVAAAAASRVRIRPGQSMLYLLSELVVLCGVEVTSGSRSLPDQLRPAVAKLLNFRAPPALPGVKNGDAHVYAILFDLGIWDTSDAYGSIADGVERFVREILGRLDSA